MVDYAATEYGYIIGLAVVRVDHSYQQGLATKWTRGGRFTYYDPRLAALGEQPVYNREIYAQGTPEDEEIFGYQEAWADYRYKPSYVTGEMRSNFQTSLDAWHYADDYNELPRLSAEWIQEGTQNIDRTISVTSEQQNNAIHRSKGRRSRRRRLYVRGPEQCKCNQHSGFAHGYRFAAHLLSRCTKRHTIPRVSIWYVGRNITGQPSADS